MSSPSLFRVSDLPDLADSAGVFAFAMTFNGYEYHGSLEACAAAAKQSVRATIEDLRNELFFAARASRHRGDDQYLATYRDLLPLFRQSLPPD